MFKKYLKPKITIWLKGKGTQVQTKFRKITLEDFVIMTYHMIRHVIDGISGMDFNRFLSQLRKVDVMVKQSEKKAKKDK